jgi:hypothetical protein
MLCVGLCKRCFTKMNSRNTSLSGCYCAHFADEKIETQEDKPNPFSLCWGSNPGSYASKTSTSEPLPSSALTQSQDKLPSEVSLVLTF